MIEKGVKICKQKLQQYIYIYTMRNTRTTTTINLIAILLRKNNWIKFFFELQVKLNNCIHSNSKKMKKNKNEKKRVNEHNNNKNEKELIFELN